ncbi:polysaccharide deacetylase family protein [Halovivax cerinus]|uniref:Polysaccharide deacetylase family protein n=1 Tax=Halovivax cerinus TaxID=1487865 RepID=A0ABD5NS72_9EURY|nr:polysaccharide deacetylase family protein [Halovivax cerinus]
MSDGGGHATRDSARATDRTESDRSASAIGRDDSSRTGDATEPGESVEFTYDERSRHAADTSAYACRGVDPAERVACLTLDLENDWYVDEPGYDHLTFAYLDDYVDLIRDLAVPVTFFVVGRTVERYPEVIDRLDRDLDCEFHLHSYRHDTTKSTDFRADVRRGVDAFESHFGYEPMGYRAPQGNIEPGEFTILEDEGFAFDSSVFPSYRPGVYNNLTAPRTPYRPEGTSTLVEMPIGTTASRIPIAHSYLKLLGRPFQRALASASLPSPLLYNTHLQDLYRTRSYETLPRGKRFLFERNIERSTDLLRSTVETLRRRGYSFTRVSLAYETYARHAQRSSPETAPDRPIPAPRSRP